MSLKEQFLIDPEIIFLNHGSYGACPKPVFDAYQRWQRELELQPVQFLGRDVYRNMSEARTALASYFHSQPENVVYFPNPTTAINMLARSLVRDPDCEVLATDLLYGAIDRTWKFVCVRAGAAYRKVEIPTPVGPPEDLVEKIWAGVTSETRIIFISHITSSTALLLPVEEICRRARKQGVLTIIDGAHVPGHLPLDIRKIDADFYVGACHKWLCAPRGSAFLYAHPAVQDLLDPLVVSWGYDQPTYDTGHLFINMHEWQGTRDISPFLSVPAAIKFQKDNDWNNVQKACQTLASEALSRISEITGLGHIQPKEVQGSLQFFSAFLPPLPVEELRTRLYDDYRIEVPVFSRGERNIIRVSIQAYNTSEEIDILIKALETLLPELAMSE